LFQIVGSFLAF